MTEGTLVKIGPHTYREIGYEDECDWNNDFTLIWSLEDWQSSADQFEAFKKKLGNAICHGYIPPKLGHAIAVYLDEEQQERIYRDFGFADYAEARTELYALRTQRRQERAGPEV